MPVTIHQPGRARREAIRDFVQYWIKRFPGRAHALSRALKELKANQYNTKTGAWRADENGHIRMRFPMEVWYGARAYLVAQGIEPPFGDDDSDITLVCEEFPDFAPACDR